MLCIRAHTLPHAPRAEVAGIGLPCVERPRQNMGEEHAAHVCMHVRLGRWAYMSDYLIHLGRGPSAGVTLLLGAGIVC